MSYSDSLDNITLDSDDILTIERFENNYYNHKNNVLQIGGVYTIEKINFQLQKIFTDILELIFGNIDFKELIFSEEFEEEDQIYYINEYYHHTYPRPEYSDHEYEKNYNNRIQVFRYVLDESNQTNVYPNLNATEYNKLLEKDKELKKVLQKNAFNQFKLNFLKDKELEYEIYFEIYFDKSKLSINPFKKKVFKEWKQKSIPEHKRLFKKDFIIWKKKINFKYDTKLNKELITGKEIFEEEKQRRKGNTNTVVSTNNSNDLLRTAETAAAFSGLAVTNVVGNVIEPIKVGVYGLKLAFNPSLSVQATATAFPPISAKEVTPKPLPPVPKPLPPVPATPTITSTPTTTSTATKEVAPATQVLSPLAAEPTTPAAVAAPITLIPAAEASKSMFSRFTGLFSRNTTKQPVTTQAVTAETSKSRFWFNMSKSGGGNNKKKLKKNIIRLYNCYILSQNQNGGANNKLSLIIKKRLDKKIIELKNLEGGTDDEEYIFFLKNLKKNIKEELTKNSTQINKMFPNNLLKEIFNNNKIREMFPIDLNKILPEMFSEDFLKQISTMYDKIFYNIIEKIIDEQKIKIKEVYEKELAKNKNNNNGILVGGNLGNAIQEIIKNALLVPGFLIWSWGIIASVPGMIEGFGKVGQALKDSIMGAHFIPSLESGRGGIRWTNLHGSLY